MTEVIIVSDGQLIRDIEVQSGQRKDMVLLMFPGVSCDIKLDVRLTGEGAEANVYGAYVFAEHQTTGATSLIGTIPIEKAELATGPYTLIIQQEKYKELSTYVTIYEAEETEIYPTLEPNFSKVILTVSDYADIYIDGHKVGKGQWDGTLEYGSYLVETRQQGHYPAYTPLTISQGDANVSYSLNNPQPIHGTLIVDGSPIDAYIWINLTAFAQFYVVANS